MFGRGVMCMVLERCFFTFCSDASRMYLTATRIQYMTLGNSCIDQR